MRLKQRVSVCAAKLCALRSRAWVACTGRAEAEDVVVVLRVCHLCPSESVFGGVDAASVCASITEGRRADRSWCVDRGYVWLRASSLFKLALKVTARLFGSCILTSALVEAGRKCSGGVALAKLFCGATQTHGNSHTRVSCCPFELLDIPSTSAYSFGLHVVEVHSRII